MDPKRDIIVFRINIHSQRAKQEVLSRSKKLTCSSKLAAVVDQQTIDKDKREARDMLGAEILSDKLRQSTERSSQFISAHEVYDQSSFGLRNISAAASRRELFVTGVPAAGVIALSGDNRALDLKATVEQLGQVSKCRPHSAAPREGRQLQPRAYFDIGLMPVHVEF